AARRVAVQMFYDPATLRLMSPAQRDAMMAQLAEDAARGDASDVVARVQRFQAFRDERRRYEQDLNTRGADIALGQPEIAQRFRLWQQQVEAGNDQAPATLASAIRQAIDWQRTAGVAEANIAPLPASIVQAITQRYAGAANDL